MTLSSALLPDGTLPERSRRRFTLSHPPKTLKPLVAMAIALLSKAATRYFVAPRGIKSAVSAARHFLRSSTIKTMRKRGICSVLWAPGYLVHFVSPCHHLPRHHLLLCHHHLPRHHHLRRRNHIPLLRLGIHLHHRNPHLHHGRRPLPHRLH